MTEALQKRVFDPFVQGDETLDRSEGGMGIGLTLVRSLVEQHGGSVHASSGGLGKGSEFVVTLPLARPPAPSPQQCESPQTPECDTTGLRLLVVEDDTDGRDMLQRLLETYGYQVTTAADGLSALRAIELEQPDVAFVDIGLPELDGYGVARHVRQKKGIDQTYLVALTGYGQPADRKRARDAGFDDHLTKPVKMDELLRILRECLNKSSSGQTNM
jgi:CheY-like chemotaxis protein